MKNLFHASQLKPAIGFDGSNANAADVPAFLPAADELVKYKVEDILDYCSCGRCHSLCVEYLVKWHWYSVFESTWELEANLSNYARTLASYQQCKGLH